MKTVTYDNPNTYRRECWQDGELICSYSAEIFHLKDTRGLKIFFGANVGDWKSGQFFGDMEAMESNK